MKVNKTACLAVGLVLILAGCTTKTWNIPNEASIIPSGTVQIAPGVSYSLEQLAMTGLAGAVLYVVYQPLAPNWTIEEAALNENTYYVRLQAKRFRIGGDGESMLVLKRRALKLQHEGGYASYRILDYSEGIESGTPVAQKFSEGIIQLVRAEQVSPR